VYLHRVTGGTATEIAARQQATVQALSEQLDPWYLADYARTDYGAQYGAANVAEAAGGSRSPPCFRCIGRDGWSTKPGYYWRELSSLNLGWL
jgi:hypothetical protein